MPYSTTSATTRADLIAAIATFANAAGWTVEYNVTGEAAFSKKNCHVALSDGGTASRSDMINGGTVTDGLIYMAIGSEITASNHHFYGHPGSIVTSSGDLDKIIVNDLAGPFTNVFLFTDSNVDSNYIHCVIQNSSGRYTYLGFGNLNKLGMSHANIGYAIGTYYIWWNNIADYSSNSSFGPNYFGHYGHVMGVVGESPNCHLYIPSGVLDTSLGFASGDQQIGGTSGALSIINMDRTTLSGAASGRLMDHFHLTANDSTTGGALLWPLVAGYALPASGLRCVLGEIPDLCLFNLSGFAARDVLTYGTDEWQVFPQKLAGESANSNYGVNPTTTVNTEFYGYAIKRLT